jgi:RNA polymerase sigma-70 factor (ECF subfamily)
VIEPRPTGNLASVDLGEAGGLEAGACEIDPADLDPGAAAPRLTTAELRRFREIFETHFDFVWRCVRRFGLSAAAADDATQQVFLIASRRIAAIGAGKERPFLFGTAMRVAHTARRTLGRRREISGEELDERVPPSAPTPDDLVERRRRRALLDRALGELPLELRAVLVLFELEGMTAPEIAALLAIPTGTVASRLRRARELFREVAERLVAPAREAP